MVRNRVQNSARSCAIFFVLIGSTLLSKAAEFDVCLDQIERSIENYNDRTDQIYAKIDGPQTKVLPQNRSFFLRGEQNKAAVLILHGFMSSPNAMRLMAEEYHKNGMTVLAPLIPGYGSTVTVANSGTLKAWQHVVDDSYRILSKCFNDISITGFSMGGGLTLDFVFNRYIQMRDQMHLAHISYLVLLSPAIKPVQKLAATKSWITRWMPVFGTDNVNFTTIEWIEGHIPFFGKKDPTIEDMMKHPEKFNQQLPVYAASELVDLADALKNSPKKFPEKLSVSLDYSEADTAADWKGTRDFITSRLFDARIFNYPKSDNLPHTLGLSEPGGKGQEIREGCARHVARYHETYAKDHPN